MSSYNKVTLIGNLTRDPELRYTPNGTAIARVGLALNRKWKTEDGQDREEVTFVDIDAFGKTAELIAQYYKKGKPLMIEGRLKLDQWEDKNTHQKQSKLKVVCERLNFLPRNEGDGGGNGGQQGGGQQGSRGSRGYSQQGHSKAEAPQPDGNSEAPQGEPTEDDVPF